MLHSLLAALQVTTALQPSIARPASCPMNTRLPALLASVVSSTRRALLPGRRPASLSAAAQRTSLHTAPKQQQESRLVGLLEPYWDAAMGVHISSIVAGLAGGVGLAAWSLRHVLPLPISVVLWHVAGTGMLVAAAATETMAGQTTGLLGKVRRGMACVGEPRRRRPARSMHGGCISPRCQQAAMAHPAMPPPLPPAARRRHHRPRQLHAAVALPCGPARQAGPAAPRELRAQLQPGQGLLLGSQLLASC